MSSSRNRMNTLRLDESGTRRRRRRYPQLQGGVLPEQDAQLAVEGLGAEGAHGGLADRPGVVRLDETDGLLFWNSLSDADDDGFSLSATAATEH